MASVEVRGADLVMVADEDQTELRVAKNTTITLKKGFWKVTDGVGNTCRIRLQRGQGLVLEWPAEFIADVNFMPPQRVTVLGQECTTTAFFALKKSITRTELVAALAAGANHVTTGFGASEVREYAAWRAKRDGVRWRVPSVAELRALRNFSEPEFGLLPDDTLVVQTGGEHLRRVPAEEVKVEAVFRLVR